MNPQQIEIVLEKSKQKINPKYSEDDNVDEPW